MNRRAYRRAEEQSGARDALNAAIEVAGGVRALARLIGVTHAAIRKWDQAPADRIIDIERATGIERGRLRPDLYHGYERSRSGSQS